MLSYAYCTAFRAMLTNMEEMKKIYLQASKGSKSKEISKDKFLHTAQQVSQATPLEIDILFGLSEKMHDSKTIIYSDLQDMALPTTDREGVGPVSALSQAKHLMMFQCPDHLTGQ